MPQEVKVYKAYDKAGNMFIAKSQRLADEEYQRVIGKKPTKRTSGKTMVTDAEAIDLHYNNGLRR